MTPGRKYGRLTVVRRIKGYSYEYKCDCGKIVTRNSSNVRSGRTSSCGCRLIEIQKNRKDVFKPANLTLQERLKNRTEYTENGCLEWQGNKNKNGYGVIKLERKRVLVHRVSYEMRNGAISPGMCVLHKCDNPSCCNTEHLFLGTRADNIKDMDNKGRRNNVRQKLFKAEFLTGV